MRDSRGSGEEDDTGAFIRPTVLAQTGGVTIGNRRKCAKDLETGLSVASSTSVPARRGFPSCTTVHKISSPLTTLRNILLSSSANPLQKARSSTLTGYDPTGTEVPLTPADLLNRPALIAPPQISSSAPTTSIKSTIVPPPTLTQLRFPSTSFFPSIATLARRLSSPYTTTQPLPLFQPVTPTKPNKVVTCAPKKSRVQLKQVYSFQAYACPLCVNSFSRFEELKLHLLSMHPRRERILRLVEAKYGQPWSGGTTNSNALPSRGIESGRRADAVERSGSVETKSEGHAEETECVEVDIVTFIGKGPRPMVAQSPEQLETPEHITLHIVSNEQYSPEASQDPKCRATEILQTSEVQLEKTQNVRPRFHNLPVPVPPVFRPWSAQPVPARPRCPHCPAKLRHKRHSCTHDLRFP